MVLGCLCFCHHMYAPPPLTCFLHPCLLSSSSVPLSPLPLFSGLSLCSLSSSLASSTMYCPPLCLLPPCYLSSSLPLPLFFFLPTCPLLFCLSLSLSYSLASSSMSSLIPCLPLSFPGFFFHLISPPTQSLSPFPSFLQQTPLLSSSSSVFLFPLFLGKRCSLTSLLLSSLQIAKPLGGRSLRIASWLSVSKLCYYLPILIPSSYKAFNLLCS